MVTGKFYRVMACPQLITYKNISSVFLVDIVYSRKKKAMRQINSIGALPFWYVSVAHFHSHVITSWQRRPVDIV